MRLQLELELKYSWSSHLHPHPGVRSPGLGDEVGKVMGWLKVLEAAHSSGRSSSLAKIILR